jgi:hypothetical protein
MNKEEKEVAELLQRALEEDEVKDCVDTSTPI